MAELKMTGNCLRGSRPLLSFDPTFTKDPHYAVLKELLVQIFGVPNHHPKSQPFFDHVYTFMILDNRIWFRNYQILSEDGALAEIGPRFVLNPVSIQYFHRRAMSSSGLWRLSIQLSFMNPWERNCVWITYYSFIEGKNIFWIIWWYNTVGEL